MKNPSVALSTMVICGAWLGVIIPLSWFALFAFILIFALIYKLIRFGFPYKSISFIFLALLVIMLGTGLFRAQYVRHTNLYSLSQFAHKQVNVIGEVVDFESFGGVTELELKTYRIECDNKQYKIRTKVRAVIYGADFEAGLRDIAAVNAELELYEPISFWGQYSSRSNNASYGVFAKIASSTAETKIIGSNKKIIDILALGHNARNHINTTVDTYMSGDEGALEKGILIGNKKDFSSELSDAFKKSGMSHIVAVSGLHVSIFIIFISFGVWSFLTNRKWRSYLLLAAIFAYTVIIGDQPSILRASLMAAFGIMVENAKLRRDTLTALMISTAALTIINPYLVHNVSFQLSFLATLGIVLLQGRICKYAIANAGVAAFLYVSPLLAYSFYTITFASLFTNIIVSPLVIISLLLGYIMCIIPYSGIVLSPILFCINHSMILVAKFFASIKLLTVYVPSPSLTVLIGCAAALYAIYNLFTGKRKKLRTLFAVTVFAILIVFSIVSAALSIRNVKVSFVESRKGDCVHIRTSKGYNILADAGSGKGTVSYLSSKNVYKVDALILTNLSAENIKATEKILEIIPVAKIYLPSSEKNILKMPENNIAELIPYNQGNNIEIDNTSIEVLMLDKYAKPQYNATAALKLSCFDTSFMLLGKFDDKHEHEMLSIFGDKIKSDVVRLANQAAPTANSNQLIKTLGADFAVDNCAYNGGERLSAQVYAELSKNGSKILKTYLSGTITFEVNKKGIKAIKRTRIPIEEDL